MELFDPNNKIEKEIISPKKALNSIKSLIQLVLRHAKVTRTKLNSSKMINKILIFRIRTLPSFKLLFWRV